MKFLFASLILSVAVVGCASDVDPSAVQEDPTAADAVDETTGASEDDATAVTYKQTGKIITANCGGCHADFKTLAGIQAERTMMIAKISSGQMPKGKPTWNKSAAGKKVLAWLKAGAVK
jgi:mono/diheme cytochrome c family protein